MIFDWLMCRLEVLNKLWSTSNASNYWPSFAMPYEMVYVKESAWYGIWDLSEKQELLIFQVQSQSQTIFKQPFGCTQKAQGMQQDANVLTGVLAVGSLDWSLTLVTMGLIRLLMRCASTKSWQLLNLLPFLLVQTSTPSLYHMVIKVTEFSFTNVIIHLSGLSVFLTNRHTPEWSDEFNGPSTMFSH